MDVETSKRMEIKNVTQNILERCLRYAKQYESFGGIPKTLFFIFKKVLKLHLFGCWVLCCYS